MVKGDGCSKGCGEGCGEEAQRHLHARRVGLEATARDGEPHASGGRAVCRYASPHGPAERRHAKDAPDREGAIL